MFMSLVFTHSAVLAQGGGGGGGVISTVSGLSSSVQTLVKGAILTIAAIFILVTLVRTRMAAGAIIVSLIVGGGAVWGVNNIDLLQTKVGNDIKNSSMSTTCPLPLLGATTTAAPGPAGGGPSCAAPLLPAQV